MDINVARSLFTVWVLISFVLVLYIVSRKRNKKNYDDAANSIIDDDDMPAENGNSQLSRDNGAK